MPAGFARQLKLPGVTGDQLFEPKWQYFLRWTAVIVSLQCCDLERRHGRNRARSHQHGQSRWDSFCARAFNAEAVLLHRAQEQLQSQQQAANGAAPAQLQPQPPEPPPQVAQPMAAAEAKRRRRAPTPQQLHFYEFLKRERALGRPANPALPGKWAEGLTAYAALPPDIRSIYERRATNAKAVVAAANRGVCPLPALAAEPQAGHAAARDGGAEAGLQLVPSGAPLVQPVQQERLERCAVCIAPRSAEESALTRAMQEARAAEYPLTEQALAAQCQTGQPIRTAQRLATHIRSVAFVSAVSCASRASSVRVLGSVAGWK